MIFRVLSTSCAWTIDLPPCRCSIGLFLWHLSLSFGCLLNTIMPQKVRAIHIVTGRHIARACTAPVLTFPKPFCSILFLFFKNPIRCIYMYTPTTFPPLRKGGGPKSNRFIWEREFTWLSRRELTIRPRLNSKSFFLQYIIRELGEINSSCSGLPHTR